MLMDMLTDMYVYMYILIGANRHISIYVSVACWVCIRGRCITLCLSPGTVTESVEQGSRVKLRVESNQRLVKLTLVTS